MSDSDVNNTAEVFKALGDPSRLRILRLIAGKHSREIETLLGKGRGDVVAIPENIVFIDD